MRNLVALAGLALVVAACGGNSPAAGSSAATTAPTRDAAGTTATPNTVVATPVATTAGAGTPATGPARGQGKVDVLYAGSLVNFMEHQVGPGFNQATGYTYEGFAGGSDGLAQQIKGKVRQGDVFLSASPSSDTKLEGQANGNWVGWYVTFATSPLVLAYNLQSSFASQFKTKPWWQVITEPGFRLGRTDPRVDPKGALTVQALDQAARANNDPALAALATSTSNVFLEQDLVGRLQAGQLDAGFFYTVESATIKPALPTISLRPLNLSATYTITVLQGAPNSAGAAAFVSYLLAPGERAALAAAGLQATPLKVSGDASAVPASLRPLLSGGQ